MIDFIIIDDNLNCSNYEDVINNIMFKRNLIYNIYKYQKNNKLLSYNFNKIDSYKIYLINISEDTLNYSINLAKKIRNNDSRCEIIFIQTDDLLLEPIIKSVRKIYCIIPKYNMKDQLENELSNIINNYSLNNIFFPLDKKGTVELSLNSILYIYRETTERKLYIVTNSNKYPVNMTLKEALKKCDNNFKQIERGCIINKTKVSLYNWNEGYFILNNGKKIYMCSKKYK